MGLSLKGKAIARRPVIVSASRRSSFAGIVRPPRIKPIRPESVLEIIARTQKGGRRGLVP